MALVTVTSLALALLVGATTAAAQGFSGPWEAGHEPPTINDPEIDAGEVEEGRFEVFPAKVEFCPDSWAVTFEDPSGSATETMKDTIDEFGFCVRSATQSTIGSPDFTITNSEGFFTKFSLNASSPEAPFLYVVTDADGTVIAQGAYTHIHGTFRINSGSTSFEKICLDDHLTLYTDPTTGVVYCLNDETLNEPGWPAPPPPEPPAPSAPSTKPATPPPPTPKQEPKPELPTLSASEARLYLKLAVENKVSVKHKPLGAPRSLVSDCKRVSRTRFKCSPSFIARGVRWRGTAQIWFVFAGTQIEWQYSLGLHGYPPDCQRSACSRSLVVR